ncbi:hypothetical protein D3C86_2103570 [compost metagenome]
MFGIVLTRLQYRKSSTGGNTLTVIQLSFTAVLHDLFSVLPQALELISRRLQAKTLGVLENRSE